MVSAAVAIHFGQTLSAQEPMPDGQLYLTNQKLTACRRPRGLLFLAHDVCLCQHFDEVTGLPRKLDRRSRIDS